MRRLEPEPPAEPSPAIATAPANGQQRSWGQALTIGICAFAVSRLCVLAGAGVRASQVTVDAAEAGEPKPGTPLGLITGVLTQWDGLWYLEIVRSGYPRSIPPDITYFQLEARAAFFPLYPLLVRAFDRILPGGDTFAALVVTTALAIVAVILVGVLARRLYGNDVAERAMVLFAVFPGSFVLSYAYAEALLIVLAAAVPVVPARRALAARRRRRRPGDGDETQRRRPHRRVRGRRLPRHPPQPRLVVARRPAAGADRLHRLPAVPRRRTRASRGRGSASSARPGARAPASASRRSATRSASSATRSPRRRTRSPQRRSPPSVLGLWCLWRKHLPWPMVAYVAVVIALMLLPVDGHRTAALPVHRLPAVHQRRGVVAPP